MSYFPVCSQGEFSAILELPEGEHEYKFCVDGRWIHDPNAVSVFNETILLLLICGHETKMFSQIGVASTFKGPKILVTFKE